ncbi:MAG: Rsd/AlgQ family anti-sigma factor [Gammaproteobacteria bacterium]
MPHGTPLYRARGANKSGIFRMTKSVQSLPDPRAITRKLIDDMLKQRQQMLVLLWELTKSDLRDIDDTGKEMLDEFSTILVDYIAAGHFGLYQRLSAGNERRSRVVDTAKEIYPRIAETTETAVAFTERFENADEKLLNAQLASALSLLAEQVTLRIELEDRLITAMLGAEAKLSIVRA